MKDTSKRAKFELLISTGQYNPVVVIGFAASAAQLNVLIARYLQGEGLLQRAISRAA